MNDSIPYWKTGEVPQVIDAGNQRFKYYKKAGLIEVCSFESDTGKEFRWQPITALSLKNNEELGNLFLEFMEDAGLIQIETDS